MKLSPDVRNEIARLLRLSGWSREKAAKAVKWLSK